MTIPGCICSRDGWLRFFAGFLIAGVVGCNASPAQEIPGSRDQGGAASTVTSVVFAAPGRIEGRGQVVELGAGGEGIVSEVLVREGESVEAGQLLVRLRSDELRAQFEAASARIESERQRRAQLVRGSRNEARGHAAALVREAEAVLEQAQAHHQRMVNIAEQGEFVSAQNLDVARRDADVARAALAGARHHEDLVNAPPLPDELAMHDAAILTAESEAAALAARLAEQEVRAPFEGTILRRLVEPGELVTRAYPQPVATMADLSHYRVRAEVDERDIGRVRIGQTVRVTASALGETQLRGTVISLLGVMGRQTVRTGDPAEKSDRDVLEVLIELEDAPLRLVVGLRVTALFEGAPNEG